MGKHRIIQRSARTERGKTKTRFFFFNSRNLLRRDPTARQGADDVVPAPSLLLVNTEEHVVHLYDSARDTHHTSAFEQASDQEKRRLTLAEAGCLVGHRDENQMSGFGGGAQEQTRSQSSTLVIQHLPLRCKGTQRVRTAESPFRTKSKAEPTVYQHRTQTQSETSKPPPSPASVFTPSYEFRRGTYQVGAQQALKQARCCRQKTQRARRTGPLKSAGGKHLKRPLWGGGGGG